LTTLSTGTLRIIYDSCVLQICDFGLAKWKQQAATQTTTGRRRGTIAYMAPEVFRDVNTPRTVKYDVYSFGVLLWELLSENKPFEYGTYRRYLFVCLSSLYFLYMMYKIHILFSSVLPPHGLSVCPSVCLSVSDTANAFG